MNANAAAYTTFGHESADGIIYYKISYDYTIEDILENRLYVGKRYPCVIRNFFISGSEVDYFSDAAFERDESIIRILYKHDGRIILKELGAEPLVFEATPESILAAKKRIFR